ncbi:hypothetical protein NQZ68_016451 [Dissostichus eleginoides]|nr:hypothetical protein NQZ68_016451 [Dissostichus eleginoides]
MTLWETRMVLSQIWAGLRWNGMGDEEDEPVQPAHGGHKSPEASFDDDDVTDVRTGVLSDSDSPQAGILSLP